MINFVKCCSWPVFDQCCSILLKFCVILPICIPFGLILSKFFHGPILSNFIKFCPFFQILYNFVFRLISSNLVIFFSWSNFVKFYSILSILSFFSILCYLSLVWFYIFFSLVRCCPILSNFFRFCPILANFIKFCTIFFKFWFWSDFVNFFFNFVHFC